MGWTFTSREKGRSHLEWFREQFGSPEGEVIDASSYLGVTYLAYRRAHDGYVTGIVVLTQWLPGEVYNFGYKDIEETMGPNEIDCPARILDQLSEPPPNDYAAQWRTACRNRLAERAARPKVRAGDIVRFAHPLRFGGGVERQVFRFVKGSLFEDPSSWGHRYRIPRWRERPYTVEERR